MGHAAHFLRRLDRVTDAECELALTLYRDDGLLEELLGRAVIPEGAERVAISLDHPSDGPFVVVTREGRFVTCLGREMRPGDLPVITRDRLDVAASRVTRMRDALARVRQLRESGAESQIAIAYRRMQQRGPRFAREDAKTLLDHPARRAAADRARRAGRALGVRDRRRGVARDHRTVPSRQADPRAANAVAALESTVWGLANLLVIVGPDDPRLVRPSLTEDVAKAPFTFARMTARWSGLAHVMRAAWVITHMGKRGLAWTKEVDRVGQRLDARFFRELCLAGIAAASPKVRAEARKAIGTATPGADPIAAHLDGVFATLGGMFEAGLEQPDSADDILVEEGRWLAAGLLFGTDAPDPGLLREIPEDVARATFANISQSILMKEMSTVIPTMFCAVPWLARAKPEELFLPLRWTERIVMPAGHAVAAAQWLGPRLAHERPRNATPARREDAKVGRNDPCPCGSGQKQKRCCGKAA